MESAAFELGFERAGIETVLQAERDPWALQVLARHWPQTERVTDVRAVGMGHGSGDECGKQTGTEAGTVAHAESRWSDIDLVYGGFPCQDLSVAGKRAGLGGERSGLWFEFERILSELRPRWAVIENVPGLLSSNGGRDLAVVLRGLEELGFWWAYRVLDAQHFGVPQRRRRVFIVAGPSRRSVEQVLSLCESCGGNPETSAAPGQAVAGTLGGGAGERGWSPDTDRMTFIPDLVGALSDDAHHGGGTNGQDAYTGRVFPAVGGVRRLTPMECERLMGWPDDWTRWTAGGKEIADSHRYRMAGNGVVASVAEWIGHRLVAVDALSAPTPTSQGEPKA